MLLPALMLCGWVLLLVMTGHGKEFAPFLVLILSFVVVPAAMLANCWTLFIGWRSSLPLFIAALVIPALAGAALMMLLHGTGAMRRAAKAALTPFGAMLNAGSEFLLALFAMWLLAMAGLYLWAHRRDAAVRQ